LLRLSVRVVVSAPHPHQIPRKRNSHTPLTLTFFLSLSLSLSFSLFLSLSLSLSYAGHEKHVLPLLLLLLIPPSFAAPAANPGLPFMTLGFGTLIQYKKMTIFGLIYEANRHITSQLHMTFPRR
jgi:hypothetical protein